MGDFNMVKDAVDRLLPHPDPAHTVEALLDLKGKLGLIDGCHWTNPPPDHSYTFGQPSGGSRSRIDIIYTSNELLSQSLDWKIEQPDITNHQLVSFHLYNLNASNIGRG